MNEIDYSEWKKEKINGEIYYMSPSANPKHSRIIGRLHHLFYNYLNNKTCEVFTDNIDVYLDEESNNYVMSDLSVLCDKDKFSDKGYHGVPSLIVEVISPTSIKRDKIQKFKLYEKFGVKEYWLVDYNSQSIEQYILIDGKYEALNIVTLIDEYDYNNRLTEDERKEYSTLINVNIFDNLIIDIKDIFK